MKVTLGEAQHRMELTLGRDETGKVTGHVYFFHDDMGADIVDGNFSHPMYGTEYRVHVPYKGHDVSVEVRTWRTVGTGKVV